MSWSGLKLLKEMLICYWHNIHISYVHNLVLLFCQLTMSLLLFCLSDVIPAFS